MSHPVIVPIIRSVNSQGKYVYILGPLLDEKVSSIGGWTVELSVTDNSQGTYCFIANVKVPNDVIRVSGIFAGEFLQENSFEQDTFFQIKDYDNFVLYGHFYNKVAKILNFWFKKSFARVVKFDIKGSQDVYNILSNIPYDITYSQYLEALAQYGPHPPNPAQLDIIGFYFIQVGVFAYQRSLVDPTDPLLSQFYPSYVQFVINSFEPFQQFIDVFRSIPGPCDH